jgi:hypothetical protein
MCQSNTKEAVMLTPLNIMSLGQGKEFARQEMKRLYAEPTESAPENTGLEISASDAKSPETARRSKWRALFAEFIGLWDAAYPIGARRY